MDSSNRLHTDGGKDRALGTENPTVSNGQRTASSSRRATRSSRPATLPSRTSVSLPAQLCSNRYRPIADLQALGPLARLARAGAEAATPKLRTHTRRMAPPRLGPVLWTV
jgi:hypothetical protein